GIISTNKTRNINIDETNSIKNWRLNIFVKFRKNENFEILSAYRHSGGERSVSTIIFLLSLLDSIQSPFRLVDEINQGMDRFNEKKVHDLLVSLSENERSPQFFIITPKIVPGLVYNERMKVFVLFPGVDVQEKFDDYRFRVVNCEGGLKGV
ncbi:Structural maintenance of chromosomes protein 5, partial [Dictyocoela roeselum]